MVRIHGKETVVVLARMEYPSPGMDEQQHNHPIGNTLGFPGSTSGKEHAHQCRRRKRRGFSSWVRKIPWRRAWKATPVFLPGESHGQRRLAGYSPWGGKELDTT